MYFSCGGVMTQSADARRFVKEKIVQPSRKTQQQQFEVKVGDIEKKLGWKHRCRQVITALTAKKFEQEAGVRLIARNGQESGESSSVVLSFAILH
jgi:hypothetical protein